MSLKLTVDYIVPEQTARIAKAAFPKGVLCLQLYDQLGTIFQDQDFAEIFPRRGQPAEAPFRLALVTLLQYAEGLSDRAAANAVRGRIDWKYLLCLELEDVGFDFSVLSEFRGRLLGGGIEQQLLEKLLAVLKVHRLVKARVHARTDSTHVLAAIRQTNRLELVIETLRAALNMLATVLPDWVQESIPASWVERYGARAEDFRLPQQAPARRALREAVGKDGYALLEALWSERAPHWLRELPAVEILRQVWVQNFSPREDGGGDWRESGNLPPSAIYINSPYDPEARYAKKRDTSWRGYKVQMTESCDADLPHLITHIHTTAATTNDNDALPAIHQALEAKALLPDTHLVDTGYVGAQQIVDSRADYSVDLFGPTMSNYHWQEQQSTGFDLAHFEIDWERQRARCPNGKESAYYHEQTDHRGSAVVKFVFARADCSVCESLDQCTRAANKRRSLTVRTQPLHEALQVAREREQNASFEDEYNHRAGIEGSISQGVRAFGLRRCRYRGQDKTRLQHIATAAAMNLVRLGAWFAGAERGGTRKSVFARTMAPLLA